MNGITRHWDEIDEEIERVFSVHDKLLHSWGMLPKRQGFKTK
jgi:hypothetical protein